MFNSLVGNQRAKELLHNLVKLESLHPLMLFTGIEGVGKGFFAQEFAKARLSIQKGVTFDARGAHPDLSVLKPEGKLAIHTMASVQQFIKEVYFPPYEAACRYFIIHDVDRMHAESANALLKTFEEPAKTSYIILTSSHRERMLPTLLSRCQKIYFQPVKNEEIVTLLQTSSSISIEKGQEIASLARGSITQALRYLQEGQETWSELLVDFLASPLCNYQKILEVASALNQMLEVKKKAWSEAIPHLHKEASSQEKEMLNKETEGIIALNLSKETDQLFERILSWYRDRHLLACGGDKRLLMNQAWLPKLQSVMNSSMPSLEFVHQKIHQAKKALDRSISFSSCIENLLLNLAL